MEFGRLVSILDDSVLTREVTLVNDLEGITFRNHTNETLTATVNGDEYTELSQVCLVEKDASVLVYLNTISRFKLDKFDLESVLSFSIS